MRILMLSWEYPPKNIGGLSTHVYNLSHALTAIGNEVHVITCEEGIAPVEENDNGVFVHRVTPYQIETDDFAKWIMQLNFAMIEEGIRLIKKYGKFDVIHAHDWLVAFCSKALKWSFNIPMVCTIHATEAGRNSGIRTDMQRYISSTEWLVTYESWKIVACSNYMKSQIIDSFSAPDDKVWVIPNGVNLKAFDFQFDWLSFRRQYAMDHEKIVFFVGRHVFEKGVQILVDAAQGIVEEYGNVKFVIAGKGPMTEELKSKVKSMSIDNKVLFLGYMDDDSRNKLYRVANVAVFPSLYEPFGIVALEAMAGGCPVVVSDTGGLGEIIDHKYNGMKMINGLTDSLRDNVLELLNDDDLSNYIKQNAIKDVEEKYTWDKVANLTMEMYNMIEEEALDTEWCSSINNNINNVITNKEISNIDEVEVVAKDNTLISDNNKSEEKVKINEETSIKHEILKDTYKSEEQKVAVEIEENLEDNAKIIKEETKEIKEEVKPKKETKDKKAKVEKNSINKEAIKLDKIEAKEDIKEIDKTEAIKSENIKAEEIDIEKAKEDVKEETSKTSVKKTTTRTRAKVAPKTIEEDGEKVEAKTTTRTRARKPAASKQTTNSTASKSSPKSSRTKK